MKASHQLAWLILGGLLGIAMAAALDRGFAASIEMRLKNFPEGVSHLPQN